MKFKKIKTALIVILMVIFAVSVFQIVKITYDNKTAEKENTELQQRFVKKVAKRQDDKTVQVPIRIDFEALQTENNDIVGWIYCPDTPINYPVVKGKDNNQYLRADLKGKYLVTGTIFVDYRNGNIGADSNYILYGHNMKNSTMFGTLVKYKEQAYYNAHPIMYYLTPNGNYLIELFAGTVVKDDSDIYQLTPQQATVEDLKAKSTFVSAFTTDITDSIITLSTCSYDFNNARYVLLGRLNKI